MFLNIVCIIVGVASGFVFGWYLGRIAQVEEVVNMGWTRKKRRKS
jgi:hypothetical protein